MAMVLKGFITSGSYSDYLSAGQVDSYSMNLSAGSSYVFEVAGATVPLDIALAAPGGSIVGVYENVRAGTVLNYTPAISGQYGVSIATDSGAPGTFSFSDYSTSADVGIRQPTVSLTDMTLGLTSHPNMFAYVGPVRGLVNAFIDVSYDNLNITATTPNVFLHSGTGNDAITVQGGTNVLDGGAGSNFLVGGSGLDTFYVDNREPSSDIWSTVVGFHTGDNATIWGLTQADFQITAWDNLGAVGYTGLTFNATKVGAPNATLTLTGFSQADLASGRITYSFGRVAGSDYVNIVGH